MVHEGKKQYINPQYRKDYPQRVPDWRWRQAIIDHAEGGDDDPFIELARAFYKDWLRAVETKDYGFLYARYTDFYLAWEIYTDTDNLRKSELEARILARENFETIAKKMSLTKEAVVLYEAVFFNVTDKLDSPSYILHHALGGDYPDTLNFESGFWKFYGYWCGPEILDLLIYRNVPTALNERNDLDRIMLQNLQQRLIIMLTMDDFKNKKDFLKLFEIYTKRAEALGSSVKGAEQTILNKMLDVLTSLSWRPEQYKTKETKQTENEVVTIDEYIKQSNSSSNSTDSK